MKRRQFVKKIGTTAGALGVAGFSSNSMAGKHEHAKKVPFLKDKRTLLELADSLGDCIEEARICLTHCINSLSGGETMMAKCIDTVTNTIEICEATKNMAILNSASREQMKSLIKVCKSFCQTCMEECKKHADHHEECKECASACEECVKQCDKTLKAMA